MKTNMKKMKTKKEKKMKPLNRKTNTNKRHLFLLSVLLLIPLACERNQSDLPEETRVINNWIWDGMNDVYLWNNQIPDLDPDAEPDSKAFFYKILYENDRNSWITEDFEFVSNLFDGVELSNGISALPKYYIGDQLVSFVEFVSPDSPASDSGVVRGDIIFTIDGQLLYEDNYNALFYQEVATFGFGQWNGEEIVPTDRFVTLKAIQLNRNPVIHHEVIEYEGKKIGYFVYTQFALGPEDEWLDELSGVFQSFQSAGVSEVVADLRYNPGGVLDLSAFMASSLAPSQVMNNSEVFVEMQWNEQYNTYWSETDLDGDGEADGAESFQLRIRLPQSDVNLDLDRVYFLTTGSTASASESLMVGLYPYMEVIQIGTTTYGKCYAAILIDDNYEPKRHNWAMIPLVMKYANAEGFSDFVDGIEPDYLVEDNLLFAKPFGSLEDPLLAKALEDITGVSPLLKKSAPAPMPFRDLEEHRRVLPVRKIKTIDLNPE